MRRTTALTIAAALTLAVTSFTTATELGEQGDEPAAHDTHVHAHATQPPAPVSSPPRVPRVAHSRSQRVELIPPTVPLVELAPAQSIERDTSATNEPDDGELGELGDDVETHDTHDVETLDDTSTSATSEGEQGDDGDDDTSSVELGTPQSHELVDEPWQSLADCESGDWRADGTIAYGTARWRWAAPGEPVPFGTTIHHGGLQFAPDTWTWVAPDVLDNAPTYAYDATPTQQVAVAVEVQRRQGWGAWPTCSIKVGLR